MSITLVGARLIPSPLLGENESRFWDIFLKAIGGTIAIAIGGAALAVRKYLVEQMLATETAQKANATAQIEARKPFDQQRQATYLDLLSTIARIGNTRQGTPE